MASLARQRVRWVFSCASFTASILALLVACGTDQTQLISSGRKPSPRGAGPGSASDGGVPARTDGGLPSPTDASAPRWPLGIAGLPDQLELASGWRLVEAFPGIVFDDPVSFVEAPGTGQVFVSEREGKLYAFERRPDVTEKRLVLDLSNRNQGENDSGLLGVAFHPEFGQGGSANRNYVYVHYAFRTTPIIGRTPPSSTSTRSRLSRFTLDPATLVADPASEVVLIDQTDQSVWHQGGALFFHPADRFLYLSVGDEGGGRCQYDNCQRIDKDLFSGVLRIDVDMRGGEVSHPIPRQPASGSTTGYFIPNDNPFVGQPGVLEEFFALGLRNAHRMTHDPVDDLVWMGEVGQEGREEINVLARGANYQWNVYEGSLPGSGVLPEAPLGIWTGPVLELDRQQALSIIGGHVYRGQRLQELVGKYIFADFSRGRIWALPYDVVGGEVYAGEMDLLMTAEFRNYENGISSFGVDSQGELYVLTLGASSKIQQLEKTGAGLNAPRTLSEIGVFSNMERREPAASSRAYSVQSPLWSDGADKRRWMALPEGQSVGFADFGPWQFPERTVFVKHFGIPLDEREPWRVTPLETRLLVAGTGGQFYGLSYKWNSAGTDAELVTDGLFETLEVLERGGGQRVQPYFYPGPRDCMTCHNPEAGSVLGVRTAQLNGPRGAGAAASENQLARWAGDGLLRDGPDVGALDSYTRLAPLTDESRSLEDRVRSYWDSNCSMCHGVNDSIRADWDARYETPLAQQGLIFAESLNGGQDGAIYLIEPGSAERSILFQRNATLSSGLRMPPLGTHRLDESYLAQLELWIRSLDPGAPP